MGISVCFSEKHYLLSFTVIKPTDAWEDWARFRLNPEPHRVLSSMSSNGSNLLSFYHHFFQILFLFLSSNLAAEKLTPHLSFLSVSIIFWPLRSPSLLPHDWSPSSGFSLLFLYHIIYLKEQGESAFAHLEPSAQAAQVGERWVPASSGLHSQPLSQKHQTPQHSPPKGKSNEQEGKTGTRKSSEGFPVLVISPQLKGKSGISWWDKRGDWFTGVGDPGFTSSGKLKSRN